MIPLWLVLGTGALSLAIVAIDLIRSLVHPHVVRAREALVWVAIYSAVAVAFALALLTTSGGEIAGQFVAGWVTEYSLSIDNLFVFAAILTQFLVPRHLQNMVLLVGILLALVLRACLIVVGVTLIASFGWIFYLFALILFVTAVRQARPQREPVDSEPPPFAEFLRRRMRVHPLALTLLAIGGADVVFALDSIPAVLGITSNAVLVVATNFFALMGLRQLYVLIRVLLDRVAYLGLGVAVILAFIAVKLALGALATNTLPFVNGGNPVPWAHPIGTIPTLITILAVLLLTAAASGVRSLVRSGEDKPVHLRP